MGRIKTTQIKRTGNDVVAMYGEKFTADYEANKHMVSLLVDMQSKKLRNIVAGYVTREMRKKQQKQ